MIKISKIIQTAIAALVATTLLMFSSCTDAVTEPIVPATYQIVEGIGLKNCKIGDDEAAFQRLFGGAASNVTVRHIGSNGHLTAVAEGVEAATIDGKIVSLIFHFTSSSYGVFDGETLKGIGRKSSSEDVIRTYGKPESLNDGPGPLISPTSWKQERSIKYWSKGLIFTFWDGNLADIRVFKVKNIE